MKLAKPTERHKESRLHPISIEIDELAALARMSVYIAEQLIGISPRSTRAARDLILSIEMDLTNTYRKAANVRKKLN